LYPTELMTFHARLSLSFAAIPVAGVIAGPADAASDVDFTWHRQRPGSAELGPAVTVRRGG
jgi:hypothetical protein